MLMVVSLETRRECKDNRPSRRRTPRVAMWTRKVRVYHSY